jgi:hypothetical protein
MSEFEQVFKVESSQYGELIVMQKRGDVYGIVSMQESKDGGTNYMRWVFPQRRVDGKNIPAEKAIPLGLKLGNRTEAIAFFKWGLAALGETVTPKNDGQDEQIPF